MTYTVTHVAADLTRTAQTFTGRANEYGWWDGDGAVLAFQRDGEYRVDVEARYEDPAGNLWVGRLRFGSAVATPNAPLIAHGRRGADTMEFIPPQWGFERNLTFQPDATAPHMHLPYFTGDVLWGSETNKMDAISARDAVVTHTSVQLVDEGHPLVQRALAQVRRFDGDQVPSLEESLRTGQVSLITAPNEGYHALGAHPDEIDLWSYMYSTAQRPGVRVREAINGDNIGGSYWRFGDPYLMQSGNGRDGDLPGDMKFFYAAAVVRDEETGDGVYAIYGTSWVLLPPDDPDGARFMPPFQGAAGGPDGGPLFTVHGHEIDVLFLPLGARPGAILETGDLFRMAGPVMPTLPSLVEYTVTAPDGSERVLGGRANAVGYFYDSEDDFVVDQPGLWTVTLQVTHDGQTSAGPVEPPFPSGGPLTPDVASFTFVVAYAATRPLRITTDLAELTPDQWWSGRRNASYEADLPSTWDGETARLVVTMPGIVLLDEDIPIAGRRVRWELDAEALNRLASNFDYESGLGDTVTVTFYAEGRILGQPAQAAGSIVTHGARLPVAPSPR